MRIAQESDPPGDWRPSGTARRMMIQGPCSNRLVVCVEQSGSSNVFIDKKDA